MTSLKADHLTRDPIHHKSNELRNRITPTKNEANSPEKQNEVNSPEKNSESDTENEDDVNDSGLSNISKYSSTSENENSTLESSKSDYLYNKYFWYIITVLILLICLVIYKCLVAEHRQELIYNEKIIIEELKKKFVNQHEITLKSIRKSLSHVINSEQIPKQPSIILLISSKDSEKTIECFAEHLAQLTKQDENFTHIRSQEFRNKSPKTVKKDIDDYIEQSSSPDQLNVILVQDIDFLSGNDATIFYKYCDDQNARFKKAVIILTLHEKQNIPADMNYKAINNIVRTYLETTWNDLHKDQFDPLYNRIAGFLGGIFQESNLKNCNL